MIFLLCAFGLFPLLAAVLPTPAIVPILLYIGLVIGAQAFRAVPKAHYAAIVLATVPNIAAWGEGLVSNTLAAAGTSAGEVGSAALNNAGVVFDGLLALGQGAVLAGMVLGAIAVFMIDRRFLWAAGYSFFGAALASVGLIHGAKVHLFESPKIALGYLFMGAVCAGFHLLKVPEREVDETDPIDVEDRAERLARPPQPVRAPAPDLGTPAGAPAAAPAGA